MNKEEARQEAIRIQEEISNKDLSYSEIIAIQNYLYNLGKKYGLIKEFKENGLI